MFQPVWHLARGAWEGIQFGEKPARTPAAGLVSLPFRSLQPFAKRARAAY